MTSATRRFAPYLIFIALTCLFLWRPVFTGQALLPGDYLAEMTPWKHYVEPSAQPAQWNPMQWDAIAQFYPWRVFYARSIRAGKIPLWNPHQFSGTPFLANGQSAALYPLNLVYVLMDPITATTVYAALHLFLAMAFMYLLLLALGRSQVAGMLGAVVFAFSAFIVLWLELPTFVGAAVWLPLALLLICRSVELRSLFHGMLAGATLALSFLAGHFQIAFYVLLAAMLWWTWKLIEKLRSEDRKQRGLQCLGACAACIAILALLAAPQVLPTFELAQNSHRVRDVTAEGYSRFIANALAPYRLVTAFVPGFFGDPSKNNYYLLGRLDDHIGSAADYVEYGMYVGVLPLMLAAVGAARIRRAGSAGSFAMLAVLGLLVASGTAINALFYYLVPGFSALGGPNRMLLLYVFGTAGLAAFGLDAVREACEPTKAKRALWLVPTLMLTVLTLLLVAASLRGLQPPTGPAVRLFAALLFASGILLIARWGAGVCKGSFAALAIALTIADLFAFGINYNPTCDRSKVYPQTALTTRLKQITNQGRIAAINPTWSLFETPDAILPPNSATVYGLYDIQGYDSLYTRAYKNRIDEIQGQDSSPIENGNMTLTKGYVDGLAEVAEWVLTTRELEPEAPDMVALIDKVDGVYIYRIANSRKTPEDKPYNPFSFRLGLFLMFLGVVAIGCAGVVRAVRLRCPKN